MKRSRFIEEQIISMLMKQVAGVATADVSRRRLCKTRLSTGC